MSLHMGMRTSSEWRAGTVHSRAIDGCTNDMANFVDDSLCSDILIIGIKIVPLKTSSTTGITIIL